VVELFASLHSVVAPVPSNHESLLFADRLLSIMGRNRPGISNQYMGALQHGVSHCRSEQFGFLASDSVPHVKCLNSPNCTANLLTDLQHPFSCKPVMKCGRNIQHNNVQTILERFVRECYGRVEHPEHLSLALENPNERPDFMVSMLRDSFLIDVRGVHPLATTYLGRNNAEVYLAEAYRQKQDKYDSIRQLHHLLNFPFVFTTCGDVYSESMTFFARMRNYFIQNDPDAGQMGGPSADAAVFQCVAA
jgi:hypothetical protein